MKDVTVSGKSISDALQSALQTLNTSEDKVNVEVIEEPKKGFLGLIGSKPATIRVTLIEETEAPIAPSEVEEVIPPQSTVSDEHESADPIDAASAYIKRIIEAMDIAIDIKATQLDSRNYHVQLSGDKIGIIIGKRGQTLNALQYLANIVANQHADHSIRIVLDAEDYRKKREEALILLAQRNADRATKIHKRVKLDPMPSFERKIIHATLQKNSRVDTVSEGVEPHRYIVIQPK
ncbi:Jag protein [Pullulanibacillus camelliae]|uniref:RNA-binding protein KhpB n=1 Tax=Pullulanibacillus camelliae TaxID=1707096 RepID=A0A8J2YJL5_9BACL|nr:RNA-binding cell elongation regulator Jag/EloR [Pullulanibacillus camelliae]GGE48201.1 Jag protein [Pullulanibacillus camelliae]